MRFTDVVAAAGRPQVHPLWLPPDKDPALKRAVRDCRVMTIHQTRRGTRKDYGTVGLHLEGSTQVLVFPKPLRCFGDRRIVGINYALTRQPPPQDPAPPMPAGKSSAKTPEKPAPRRPDSPPEGGKLARVKPPPSASKFAGPPRQYSPPLTREELVHEIRRALSELKAGKTAAARERLDAAAKAGGQG